MSEDNNFKQIFENLAGYDDLEKSGALEFSYYPPNKNPIPNKPSNGIEPTLKNTNKYENEQCTLKHKMQSLLTQ